MRAAGLEPLEPYVTNKQPWRCRCLSCGDEVTPTLGTVMRRGGGCRRCGSARSADRRRMDEATAVARLRAAGAEPLAPYRGTSYPWPSRCLTCRREITPRLASVKDQGACPYCARNRIDAEEAAAVMREAGLEPLEPYQGTHHKWLLRCAGCGDEIRQTLSRVRAGHGCKACGIRRRADRLRLDPVLAEARANAVGMEPLEPYPGRMSARWRCRCQNCGRESKPTLSNMSGGHACFYCRRHGEGFAREAPAVVYVAESPALGAYKVGVAGQGSRREHRLAALGWEFHYRRKFSTGGDALAAEAALLAWIREDLASPPYVSRDLMPLGGHSETIDPAAASIPQIVRKLRGLSV
jgi:rRNA maturation endonuclease Nob1